MTYCSIDLDVTRRSAASWIQVRTTERCEVGPTCIQEGFDSAGY